MDQGQVCYSISARQFSLLHGLDVLLPYCVPFDLLSQAGIYCTGKGKNEQGSHLGPHSTFVCNALGEQAPLLSNMRNTQHTNFFLGLQNCILLYKLIAEAVSLKTSFHYLICAVLLGLGHAWEYLEASRHNDFSRTPARISWASLAGSMVQRSWRRAQLK